MGGTTIRIATAAVLGAVLLGVHGAGPGVVGALYVAAVTVPLVVVDVREHRLPNAVVLPGYAFVGVGVVWAWLARGSPPGVAVVCVVGVVVAGVVFGGGGRGVGMGDVKLAGVLGGALVGVVGEAGGDAVGVIAVAAFLGAAVVTGVLAGVVALWGGRGRRAEIALGPVLLGAFWGVVVLW